jgi:hypothetical protein
MANVKSQILNPITGRAKFNFLDDGTLCDAITGKTVGIIVGDQLISAITGETIASVVFDNNGNIDLSFITAAAEDILKGKVGADVNGNPIAGTLELKGGGEYYKCAAVNTETLTWSGYKAILTTAEDGNEYYTFEETFTEGLTFSDIHFTPVINGIYNDGCTIMVEKLSQYKEKVPFRLTAAQNNASVRLNANGSPDASKLYYRTFINGALTDWALYTVGTQIILPTMDVDYVEFENRQAKFSTDANNYFSFYFYGSDYTKLSPSGDIMSLHGYTEECTPYCFYSLFRDTYGLVGEITLPATTLANSCYQHMINSGQSGEQGLAVNIMATTLADNAMNNLMANCGVITSIRVKFTEWRPDNAFSSWVYFPAGFKGTFYKPAALPEEQGSNRIPYGATVVNE